MTYEELVRKSPTYHAIYWWMVQHPGRWMKVGEFSHAMQFPWSNGARRWFSRNWPEWSPETRRKGMSLQIRVVKAGTRHRNDIVSLRRARIEAADKRLAEQAKAEAQRDTRPEWARSRPYVAPRFGIEECRV